MAPACFFGVVRVVDLTTRVLEHAFGHRSGWLVRFMAAPEAAGGAEKLLDGAAHAAMARLGAGRGQGPVAWLARMRRLGASPMFDALEPI